LGSSNTRTKEQEIKGRDLILQKITETTENLAMELKFFFYVFSFLPLVRERPFNLKGEVMYFF
jgi:hypothetical protein